MTIHAPFKVLFLCTGNSARSIFGEYFIRKLGKGHFKSYSAGADPRPKVNPYALRVLQESFEIDASAARPKSWDVVLVFIVIPLIAGWGSRIFLLRMKGRIWFETQFLPFFRPLTIIALLLTLVLIFAFQAQNIIKDWLSVVLLAVPIIIQVYFNSSLTYGLMRLFKVRHNIATPGALIGASNFFELAVAVAITLFGAASLAALATVVGYWSKDR